MKRLILLGLIALPVFASPARVHVPASAACFKTTNNSTALTCDATTPPTVGNMLVVAVLTAGSNGAITLTDNASPSNTYTPRNSGTFSAEKGYQFSAPVAHTTAGTFTITASVSGSASMAMWIAGEYSGADPTSIDAAPTPGSGSGGHLHCSVTAAFVTTTNAHDLIVAVAGINGTTPTAGTSPYVLANLTGGNGSYPTLANSVTMDALETATEAGLDVQINYQGGQNTEGCFLVAYKPSATASAVYRRRSYGQ